MRDEGGWRNGHLSVKSESESDGRSQAGRSDRSECKFCRVSSVQVLVVTEEGVGYGWVCWKTEGRRGTGVCKRVSSTGQEINDAGAGATREYKSRWALDLKNVWRARQSSHWSEAKLDKK